MGALVEKLKHRRFGRETRRESKACRAAFEFGEGGLERGACRIARARIFPARVYARRRLRKRRGGEDRRDDSASFRIAFRPAVDCARGETCRLRVLVVAHGQSRCRLRSWAIAAARTKKIGNELR